MPQSHLVLNGAPLANTSNANAEIISNIILRAPFKIYTLERSPNPYSND